MIDAVASIYNLPWTQNLVHPHLFSSVAVHDAGSMACFQRAEVTLVLLGGEGAEARGGNVNDAVRRRHLDLLRSCFWERRERVPSGTAKRLACRHRGEKPIWLTEILR
jgi:hypothetical protein